MEAFSKLQSVVVPIDQSNVDTDAIIPKQYLKAIGRTGFGDYLFDERRYLDPGSLDTPVASRRLNPDFALNQRRYSGGAILLARSNFGCGSSREHAVWALMEYGFRVVIANGFADIFRTNCLQNGLLTVDLPAEQIDQLFRELARQEGYELTVDLETQRVTDAAGRELAFDIADGDRQRLLSGEDYISGTLNQAEAIRAFEDRRRREAPWLFDGDKA